MKEDILSLVEAAYDVERAEPDWIDGLLAAAEPMLNGGMGLGGYLYDSSTMPMKTWGLASRAGLPIEALEMGCATFSDDYRRANWLVRRFGTLMQFPELIPHVEGVDLFAAMGIRDVVALNALDHTGIGFWIAAPQPAVWELTPEKDERWSRVALHIAASVRLRARLARANQAPTRHAEAVISANGKIEDARGDAETRVARERLREAALAIDRARGSLRHRDADAALQGWPALIRGRWTLVDHFESDGKRYILAHTNAAAPPAPTSLSAREREVLERALLGRENKLIGYELGLADSTVRVLMSRAATKLGVRTRAEAIDAYRRLRADAAPEDPKS
jgi:DNA-binding CsgD family transcriptional regulator